jgi:two-component system, NarL family, sensor kinase
MWIGRHLRLSHAYSNLETLTEERAQELQRLTQRLLRVQDDERRKLARDLHDTTGQTLAALKISVTMLQEKCQAVPSVVEMAAEVAQLASQAIDEIRTMSYLLHPPLLDEIGFACAAEWYIEGFAKRSGIKVKADLAVCNRRPPNHVEIALFRVLQECLTNIHRHSGASHATIRYEQNGESVRMEVRDFGKGIPEERLRLLRGAAGAGVGLTGMRERLHELGGSLEIESDAHGTTMRATVPLGAMSHLIPIHTCMDASVRACA